MEITLNDIQEYLGQTGKKQHNEVVFSCPICNSIGHDRTGNNLKYNTKKNVLYCFYDEYHSRQILSEIMKKKNEEKRMNNTQTQIPRYIKLQEQYLYYMELCNMMLLGQFNERWLQGMVNQDMYSLDEYKELKQIAQSEKPQKAREYLKQKRGINTSTIELVGLGFDFIEKKWVIPIFDMSANLVGFEYRYVEFEKKKIWRENGTPSCLARVYGNGRRALVLEGFWDSFCALQMAKNKEELSIFSTSAGVSALPKVINQLQFNKYDSITLILDTDEPADKVTNEIISTYGFIKDGRKILKDSGCKDVNQYMLEVRK